MAAILSRGDELKHFSVNYAATSKEPDLESFIGYYVNPNRLYFQIEHKHVFTFCVISPNWNGAGSWNPSSNKTNTYLFYIVNIMAADILAT